MTALEQAREGMIEFLQAGGVHALAAWGPERKKRHDRPVAAVSLSGISWSGAGLGEYLGRSYNREKDCWDERYGKRAELLFALDLYAPAKDGAQGCERLFGQVTDLLAAGRPEGLQVSQVSRGEVSFSQESGMYVCRAEAKCAAWLYAAAEPEEDALLLDFRIRGERKV